MTPAPLSDATVIRAGWLIDGQGGNPLSDQLITLHNHQIVSVAPTTGPGALPEDGVDLSHATILPGLMDAHVHLALSGTPDPTARGAQLNPGPQQTDRLIGQHLSQHLRRGVVAVRDAGDKGGRVLAYRDKGGPHLAATCWAWHCPGRYGSMIGQPLDQQRVSGKALVKALAGADHIKLIQSGLNSLDHFGRQTRPQFSTDLLNAIGVVTRKAGLPMMVHANGEVPVAMAIAAGCRSIEHGYFMGQENMKKMADQQITWVPTAIPMAALIKLGTVTPSQADVAQRTLDDQLAQIHRAHQKGVPIALGTDAGAMGVHHGTAVAREIDLLVNAGLSIGAAVRCASLNAAQLMGLQRRGAIRPGWRADLIAVPGPPDDVPKRMDRIEAIWMNGETI